MSQMVECNKIYKVTDKFLSHCFSSFFTLKILLLPILHILLHSTFRDIFYYLILQVRNRLSMVILYIFTRFENDLGEIEMLCFFTISFYCKIDLKEIFIS